MMIRIWSWPVSEFFLEAASEYTVWWVICLTGVVTYITRSSGHMVLARFKHLHPRVEAALEAVPAAVLATIVIPPALTNGPLELAAMLAALVASFRMSPLPVMAVGLAIVICGRLFGY